MNKILQISLVTSVLATTVFAVDDIAMMGTVSGEIQLDGGSLNFNTFVNPGGVINVTSDSKLELAILGIDSKGQMNISEEKTLLNNGEIYINPTDSRDAQVERYINGEQYYGYNNENDEKVYCKTPNLTSVSGNSFVDINGEAVSPSSISIQKYNTFTGMPIGAGTIDMGYLDGPLTHVFSDPIRVSCLNEEGSVVIEEKDLSGSPYYVYTVGSIEQFGKSSDPKSGV